MSHKLLGWTPSSTDSKDDLDLHRRPDAPRPEYWSTGGRPLSTHFELAGRLDTDLDTSDPPRKGDPNWVARPRNAFIIFRCEYSKRNARGPGSTAGGSGPGGKRGLSFPGSGLDKTMSKRAGDAWKLLSKAQKAHYKQLADQEKKEHALAHPGYRYRPRRGNPPSSSQRRHHHHHDGGESSQVVRASHSADSRLETSYASSDEDTYVTQTSPVVEVAPPAPAAVEPTPRFLKRRSISVPLLPPLLLTPQERLGMRRTKSNLLTTPSSPVSSPGSSFSELELLYPEQQDHDSALGFGSPLTSTTSVQDSKPSTMPSYTIPPLAAVSSSLANWNGTSTLTTDSHTAASTSSSESSPNWLATPPSAVEYPSYLNPEGYASGLSQTSSYWNVNGGDQAALYNYNLGLMDHVTSTPDDYLLFDTPAIDEQQLFEGFCHF